MTPWRRRQPHTRRLIGVLLLAMLLAQMVARFHAIAHAGGLGPAGPEVHAAAEVVEHTIPEASTAATAQTDEGWGHAAGSSACQWFDHLLLDHAPVHAHPSACQMVAAEALALPPATAARSGATQWSIQARGPPRA